MGGMNSGRYKRGSGKQSRPPASRRWLASQEELRVRTEATEDFIALLRPLLRTLPPTIQVAFEGLESTRTGRRGRPTAYTPDFRERVLTEFRAAPNGKKAAVARAYNLSTELVYRWSTQAKKRARYPGMPKVPGMPKTQYAFPPSARAMPPPESVPSLAVPVRQFAQRKPGLEIENTGSGRPSTTEPQDERGNENDVDSAPLSAAALGFWDD
jgi:hypothetical protein